MVNEIPCGCGTLRSTAVRIWHEVTHRACAEVWAVDDASCRPAQMCPLCPMSPAGLRRGLRSSKIVLSWSSNLGVSWMHLHDCRCYKENLRMLLQSLRAWCTALGGPRSIWRYLEAPARATGESGRFACGFLNNLHFADVCSPFIFMISSWHLNVASASGVPLSISTATSQFSIRASTVKSACHIPTVSSWLTND